MLRAQNDLGRICPKKLRKSLATSVLRGLILSSSFGRHPVPDRKPNLRVTRVILRLVQDRHPRLPLGQLLPRLVGDRKLYQVALSETGALPRDCSNALHAVGADRRGRGLSWWTMPSKGSQVARARNIDGEMVVSHEGPYKRPPRRTIAASKDHHVRMASPPLPPPEATEAMETHPI